MTISQDVYLSRDTIRTQLVEQLKNYMELENVDLTKTSFLSYVIDSLSSLTSNILFYQSNIYKEFFLTQAQLPESIYNLSSFLGYTPSEANYASANALVTIPLTFDSYPVNINLDSGFKFQTGDSIPFVTYYDTNITVSSISSVSVEVTLSGRTYNLPVIVDSTSDVQFQFVLPVRQYTSRNVEFQIDSDIETYQFPDHEITLDGKLSNIDVNILPQGAELENAIAYTRFNSLFLMSATDYGYVLRRTVNGRNIMFGNGLIGIQPDANSTVYVTIEETLGAGGNVIAGTITTGERMYETTNNSLVNYTVINPSPATGGTDEESTQDIRSNAIANLTSLNRLVTEDDYQNISTIITDVPFAGNTIPVLKRSDLKVNEIQLYTSLLFDSDLVPTKNIYHSIDSTASLTISRGDIIPFDGSDYISLFNLTVDTMNTSAEYTYVVTTINVTPDLVSTSTYESVDDFVVTANELTISNIDSTAFFVLSYYSDEVDLSGLSCEMTIVGNDPYDMDNSITAEGGTFTTTIDYVDVPSGTLNITFKFFESARERTEYSTTAIFKQNLEEFMMSNVMDDTTAYIIYDIPVILASYYNGLTSTEQKAFELSVMQALIGSMDLVEYRMLTDFVNVKFCNTTGTITNMNYNETTKDDVVDIGITTLPVGATIGDKYIIGNDAGSLSGNKNKIATLTSTGPDVWNYVEANLNDIVYVTNKSAKYIYTSDGWVIPEFDLPLEVEIECIRRSSSSISELEVITNTKTAIMSAYEDRFGPNISLYRSELIDTIQSVEGVLTCRLLKPTSSIFFDYDLNNFSQTELLQYAPEWVYFTEDDITVRVITID